MFQFEWKHHQLTPLHFLISVSLLMLFLIRSIFLIFFSFFLLTVYLSQQSILSVPSWQGALLDFSSPAWVINHSSIFWAFIKLFVLCTSISLLHNLFSDLYFTHTQTHTLTYTIGKYRMFLVSNHQSSIILSPYRKTIELYNVGLIF